MVLDYLGIVNKIEKFEWVINRFFKNKFIFLKLFLVKRRMKVILFYF